MQGLVALLLKSKVGPPLWIPRSLCGWWSHCNLFDLSTSPALSWVMKAGLNDTESVTSFTECFLTE